MVASQCYSDFLWSYLIFCVKYVIPEDQIFVQLFNIFVLIKKNWRNDTHATFELVFQRSSNTLIQNTAVVRTLCHFKKKHASPHLKEHTIDATTLVYASAFTSQAMSSLAGERGKHLHVCNIQPWTDPTSLPPSPLPLPYCLRVFPKEISIWSAKAQNDLSSISGVFRDQFEKCKTFHSLIMKETVFCRIADKMHRGNCCWLYLITFTV